MIPRGTRVGGSLRVEFPGGTLNSPSLRSLAMPPHVRRCVARLNSQLDSERFRRDNYIQ